MKAWKLDDVGMRDKPITRPDLYIEVTRITPIAVFHGVHANAGLVSSNLARLTWPI